MSPDAQPLNLYQFIQWVELQQEERARIAEVVVPDSDDDAVRIMTMHVSKGLEFPVVFVLGLAQDPRRNDKPLFFDPVAATAEIKLGSIASQGYSRLQDIEDAHSGGGASPSGIRGDDAGSRPSLRQYVQVHYPGQSPVEGRDVPDRRALDTVRGAVRKSACRCG